MEKKTSDLNRPEQKTVHYLKQGKSACPMAGEYGAPFMWPRLLVVAVLEGHHLRRVSEAKANRGRGLTPVGVTGLEGSAHEHPAKLLAVADGPGTMTAELRRLNGAEVPETGRSSLEGTMHDRLSAASTFWGRVSPVIDFQMLSLLNMRAR